MNLHKKGISRIFLGIVLYVLLPSCSEYQKVVKGSDYGLKYEKAVEYYDKEDYYKALPLFEELLNIYKGTSKAQEIYYYFAYCNYGMGDYLLSAYHFQNYVNTFPRGTHAEECQYMIAYCNYKESPEFNLDQTYTAKAIGQFQLFLDLYPQTERKDECNRIIDELREKMEMKVFYNAKLYYKTGYYKSAIVALKNTLKEYPASEYRDEIYFLILKSNYLLATKSVDVKKKERYVAAKEAFFQFANFVKESPHLKEAEAIYKQTIQELQKL